MRRKMNKNSSLLLIYAVIVLSTSFLFSNFFSERLSTHYYRPFLENSGALMTINYFTDQQLETTYISTNTADLPNLDFYLDFGTYTSNLGILGINLNNKWTNLPLYKGHWFTNANKNEVVIGKNAYLKLKATKNLYLFGDVYEIVGVIDDLTGNDYFNENILFDLETMSKKNSYPQNLSAIIFLGQLESVETAVTNLNNQFFNQDKNSITYDEMIEFPSMTDSQDSIRPFRKNILEFLLLIVITLIIISDSYLDNVKREISIRKWLGQSYEKVIMVFAKNYLLAFLLGAALAYLCHIFVYYGLEVAVIRKPYVEVFVLDLILGTIVLSGQLVYLSLVYLKTTAVAFFKGAE